MTQVLKDLIDFQIDKTMNEICSYPIENWKQSIKLKTTQNALTYLNSKVGTKSHKYEKLQMSNFLLPNEEEIPIETAKFIAKIQTHMIETVKSNFPGEYKNDTLCNSCKSSECNQPHLIYCKSLIGSNQLITYIPNYEDIFDDNNTKEQLFIANIMIESLKKKKEIENI